MSKTVKILIVSVVAIGLAVLLYFLSGPEKENESNKKEDKPWLKKELKDQKRNSNGTFLLYELLKDYKNTVSLKTIDDPLKESLKTYNTDYPTIYFLIDPELSFSEESTDTLINFVMAGGNAFIATTKMNSMLYDNFFSSYPVRTYRDTMYELNFFHQDLALNKNYPLKIKRKGKVKRHPYHYFEEDYSYYKNEMVTISTENKWKRPVFIKIKIGKGWIYLHSVPEAFYNSSMFEEEGLAYAESVFSDLPRGHYLWYEHSKKWDPNNDYKNNKGNNRADNQDSPLKYILEKRSLRWGYLTLIFSLLLYILFKIKRKQRIIPAVEPNNNNTLDFVETVSKLYLRQEKHYKFIKHYEQSFLTFIKEKYYIAAPAKVDESYIEQVSVKADIKKEKLEEIFVGIKQAKTSYSYSAQQLIELHKKIEYFYKNCK